MSELDNAMEVHMAYIVFRKHRPFSYQDFLCFEMDGKEYRMTHGTFRNKVSRLVKEGAVELDYISGLGFYTLKGQNFGKPMTPNHTGDSSLDPIVRLIRNLPFEKRAIHDIHLRFQVKGCWALLSSNSTHATNTFSKDVCLPLFKVSELRIRVTVHKTDTISVVVGCSYAPVVADILGVIRLSNALTRVEERLTKLMEECGRAMVAAQGPYDVEIPAVPDYGSWVISMWHFGTDASIGYSGERFCATWEVGQRELLRVYSKEFQNQSDNRSRARGSARTKIRVEMQQYPEATLQTIARNILQNNCGGL